MNTPLPMSFASYPLLMVGIGSWAWRSSRNFDDHLLGGRSLGSFVTALGAGASGISGWRPMGLQGAIYLGGVRHPLRIGHRRRTGLLIAVARTDAG